MNVAATPLLASIYSRLTRSSPHRRRSSVQSLKVMYSNIGTVSYEVTATSSTKKDVVRNEDEVLASKDNITVFPA